MVDSLSLIPATAVPNVHLQEDYSEDKCLPPVSNSKKTTSHVGPWRLGRTLGKGSSGRVRLAKHTVTDKLAAVKIVPKSVYNISNDSGKEPYGIEREIIIMKLIQHPNVMALYDVWENKGELYLVLEYVEGGELFNHLITKGRLGEAEAINYFSQIVHGVDYCHRLNICHRDLKPENLLLDKHRNIKIADFGMAALEMSDKMLETSCGSPHYASPEIVTGKNYHGAPSDIWSCGVILFALLTGQLPFDDDNIRHLLFKVQKGKFTLPDFLSKNAKDLIRKMLRVNPDDRITIPDILKHPLLAQYKFKHKTYRQHMPTPFDTDILIQPIDSEDEIDPEILKNLQTLWHGASRESVIQNLLSKEQNYEKTFYFLLMKYRKNHSDTNTRKHHPRRCKSSSNKTRSRSRAHSRSRSRSRARPSRMRPKKSQAKQKSISPKSISRESSPVPPLPAEAENLLQTSMCIETTQSLSEFASMIEQTFDLSTPTSIQYQSSVVNSEDSPDIYDKIHAEKGSNLLETFNQNQIKNLPLSPALVSPPPTPLFSQAFEEDRFADAVEEEVDLHAKRRLERTESKQARKLFLETPPPRKEIKPVLTKRTRHSSSVLKHPSIDENHATPSSNQITILNPDSSFVESQLHISELLREEPLRPRFGQISQSHAPISTFTSQFGPNTKFTMKSSMQLNLPKPLEARHFNPNNTPIFDKPRVRMHNRSSEVSLGSSMPEVPEVYEKPKPAPVTPRTVSPPSPTSSPTSSAVSKSKNILRKLTLVPKRITPSPPQHRVVSNITTSTQESWLAKEDTSFAITPTTQQDKISRQPSIQPKQNWFMKILSSGRSETKGFYSQLAPAELRRAIIIILSEWQRYGISHISEEESSNGYLIRAKVSSTNVLKMRSARFRIELNTIISGAAASRRSRHRDSSCSVFESTSIIIVRERGSSNSFLRFLGELERELGSRELLQLEDKLESVKTARILV